MPITRIWLSPRKAVAPHRRAEQNFGIAALSEHKHAHYVLTGRRHVTARPEGDLLMIAGVRLRRATGADAGNIADLYLRARRHAVPHIPPLVHRDDDVRQWMRGVLAEHEVWLASSGD